MTSPFFNFHLLRVHLFSASAHPYLTPVINCCAHSHISNVLVKKLPSAVALTLYSPPLGLSTALKFWEGCLDLCSVWAKGPVEICCVYTQIMLFGLTARLHPAWRWLKQRKTMHCHRSSSELPNHLPSPIIPWPLTLLMGLCMCISWGHCFTFFVVFSFKKKSFFPVFFQNIWSNATSLTVISNECHF